MKNWIKRALLLVLVLLIISGYFIAIAEKPTAVDLGSVSLGPMEVTVDEEGIAQVQDIYTVSSPIAGHLERVTLEQGDPVVADQTIIASIHPLDPPFLDERTRTELTAAIEAANSAVAVANVEHQRALTSLQQTLSANKRMKKLADSNLISTSDLENSDSKLQLAHVQVKSALATIRLREAELDSIKARLQQSEIIAGPPKNDSCCADLLSPIDGIILDVILRSETAVAAGTPVAIVGDPHRLEIIVDLLTTDAVKVNPGAAVKILDWGGDEVLSAIVRRIDPAAFKKISALGIEEQRVNVVLDLATVPPGLGHGYRVYARIVIWSDDAVLQVPIAAMFRTGGKWSVFVANEGKARLSTIEVGHINSTHAQILDGLEENDAIVLYPSDLLEDGGAIIDRSKEL